MIHLAERVEAIECAHSLEAEVRELRLIAAHKPPYNRRSKFPERTAWIKLTAEAYPRLSLVARIRADGGTYLGPFSSRHSAELAVRGGLRGAAAAPLHPSAVRPPAARPPARWPSSVGAPPRASSGQPRRSTGSRRPAPVAEAFTGDPGPVVRRLLARIERLAAAPAVRGGGAGALPAGRPAAGRVRMQRLTALTSVARDRRRPAGSQGRLGDRAGPTRAAGRGRRLGPADAPAHRPRRPAWRPPRPSGPGPDRPRAPAPRRASGCCPGWSGPRSGWSRCPTGWAYPVSGAARFADLLTTVDAAGRAGDAR